MTQYISFLLIIPMLFAITQNVSAQANYIWIEAEKADKANVSINISKGPRGEVLSGGQWINQTFGEDEIKAGKLGDGIELSYNVNVEQEGLYRFWIRLGYESVRTPLMWRMDGGDWQEIKPTDLTRNLIELSNWCEAGWISPAEINLSKGAHTLDLKADKPNEGRFLLGIDAIAFVQGDWLPEDKLKPDQEPDTEIDIQAKEHIFAFTDVKELPERTELSLNGLWQICRYDDMDMDSSLYEPMKEMPENPKWRGIGVPSDIRSSPELDMAHRVWYRCRVEVPESLEGRSFLLDFLGTNWIASVVVNGEFIYSHKSTRIPWKLDITKAIKAGQINEIMVGIKDVWYAMDSKYHKKRLDEMRNIPIGSFRNTRFVAPVYPSTKGDADGTQCGITDPISLIVAGPVYIDDVFIRTDYDNIKVTIFVNYHIVNNTKTPASITLTPIAVFENSGEIEKYLGIWGDSIPANGTIDISWEPAFQWDGPKLWWPGDDPANMYRFVIPLAINNKIVDIYEQRFGFRQITIDGKYIRVNGLRYKFWNLLDGLKGDTSDEMLAHFRKGNNRFERFSEDLGLRRLFGSRRDQLDWSDTHGIPGRLSTMIDGMFINYDLTNPVVWENFREHVVQVVLAYRNHPSVFFYSLENELVLINGRLGYGDKLDEIEAKAKWMIQDARNDSSRLYMLDGAGALKDNSLEINNLHYPEPSTEFYPENAYTLEKWGGFGERWIWDKQRPLAMGETAFFSGKNSEHAWIGGDSVYLGRSEAKKAYAKYVRILFEGYRWNDVAMICPWVGMDDFPDCWIAMSPLAAFVREYNTGFFAGDKVSRTVKIFNDTLHGMPIEFSWAVKMKDTKIAGETHSLTIAPGFSKEMVIEFDAPQVDERTEAKLYLMVKRDGDQTFEDVKELAFFPGITSVPLKKKVYVLENGDSFSKAISKLGIQNEPINAMSEAIYNNIVVIAPNFLTEDLSKSDEFRKYAEKGTCFICLEQEHSFTEPAFPIKATNHQAYYTFPLGYGASLLEGLEEMDFSNWAGSLPTASKVWEPQSARSWIACGNELRFSAMVEMPYSQGVIIASQMRIGASLETEPTAQVLLANSLKYCDSYKPISTEVVLFAPEKPEMADFIKASGFGVKETNSLTEALNKPNTVIIHASKANLESLSGMKDRIDKFMDSGGWIMFWGLDPEGLEVYNELLGTEHLIREFRLEKVSIERDIFTAGLGNRDVLQYTDEEIMHGDKWLSQDVFTCCVDGADIAPFCKLPGQKDEPYHPTKDDHDPYNLVNGMTGQDFWRYILQIWHGNWENDNSPPFVFGLPLPCKISKVKIWNNANYNTIKDIDIQLDGETVATLELPDGMMPAETDLDGKIAKDSLSLIVRSIRKRQERVPLVGIDNVQIMRELPEWYKGRVFPMVNVSGLVRYPVGKGGFVLNQIKITDQDTKENITKKQRIARLILENMK